MVVCSPLALGAAVHRIQYSYLMWPSSRDPIVAAIVDQGGTLAVPATDPCQDLSFVGLNAQGYEEYESEIDPSGWVDPITLVRIPAGTFDMGQMGVADPVHQVTLTQDYLISKYEITNAQYKFFCDATGYPYPPTNLCCGMPSDHFTNPLYSNHPVVMVSWDDLNAPGGFLEWAGLDLPTEAQWEYAARGSDGRTYPWGSEAPDAGGVYRANYCQWNGSTCTSLDGFELTNSVDSPVYTGFESPFGTVGQREMDGSGWRTGTVHTPQAR
jgi:hypothetical protein